MVTKTVEELSELKYGSDLEENKDSSTMILDIKKSFFL